jgi:hypothetical protein
VGIADPGDEQVGLEPVVHVHEAAVAGGPDHPGVEVHVDGQLVHVGRQVADRARTRRRRLQARRKTLNSLHLVGRRRLRRAGSRRRLDHETDLVQLVDLVRAHRRDDRVASGPDDHEALCRQQVDRVAHRRDADAEAGRDPRRRDALARPQLPAHDLAPQGVMDLALQRAQLQARTVGRGAGALVLLYGSAGYRTRRPADTAGTSCAARDASPRGTVAVAPA